MVQGTTASSLAIPYFITHPPPTLAAGGPQMTDIEPLSLATLGRELDSARRARTGNPHPTSPFIENDPDLTGHEPSEPSQSSSGTSSNQDQVMERPFPLCLVCLTRPPTAVLLPCKRLSPVFNQADSRLSSEPVSFMCSTHDYEASKCFSVPRDHQPDCSTPGSSSTRLRVVSLEPNFSQSYSFASQIAKTKHGRIRRP